LPSIVQAADLAAPEGTALAVSSSYSDYGYDCPACVPAVTKSYRATIDWGDGATEPAGVIQLTKQPDPGTGLTTGQIGASHTYVDDGVYTVTTCVTDEDGANACGTRKVTVSNVAPSVVAGADLSLDEGGSIALAPAIFTDPS